jgi:hypothetical protein
MPRQVLEVKPEGKRWYVYDAATGAKLAKPYRISRGATGVSSMALSYPDQRFVDGFEGRLSAVEAARRAFPFCKVRMLYSRS